MNTPQVSVSDPSIGSTLLTTSVVVTPALSIITTTCFFRGDCAVSLPFQDLSHSPGPVRRWGESSWPRCALPGQARGIVWGAVEELHPSLRI